MSTALLPPHGELLAASRLRPWISAPDAARAADWCLLLSAGSAAALASGLLDLNLRMPGHAILRVVVPMGLGLALVPRRGAGVLMGVAALFTAMGLRVAGCSGDGLSLGALTSLVAAGPLLDVALRRTTGGWRLYAAFAAAGLVSNLLAFGVKFAAKATGFEGGSKPLGAWLMQAPFTYVICGALAGLAAGIIGFHARRTAP
jgi:hypothetical protein